MLRKRAPARGQNNVSSQTSSFKSCVTFSTEDYDWIHQEIDSYLKKHGIKLTQRQLFAAYLNFVRKKGGIVKILTSRKTLSPRQQRRTSGGKLQKNV